MFQDDEDTYEGNLLHNKRGTSRKKERVTTTAKKFEIFKTLISAKFFSNFLKRLKIELGFINCLKQTDKNG